MPDTLPFLSVIIPAYNSADTIEAAVNSIINQSYPRERYEIIVVDNNSLDKTAELIKNFPLKLITEKKAQGPSAARNAGADIAKGEWLVFFDSDQIAQPDYLIQIMKGSDNPMVGAIASRNIGVNTSGSLAGDYWIAEWSGENLTPQNNNLVHVSGGNFAIRAEAFRQLNGFDLSFITYEDVDLAWRLQKDLKLKINYNRDAVSDHKERVSISALLRREIKLGMGSYRLLQKHPKESFGSFHFCKKSIARTVLGFLAIIKKSLLLIVGKEKFRNIQMVSLGIAMNWAECYGHYKGKFVYRHLK